MSLWWSSLASVVKDFPHSFALNASKTQSQTTQLHPDASLFVHNYCWIKKQHLGTLRSCLLSTNLIYRQYCPHSPLLYRTQHNWSKQNTLRKQFHTKIHTKEINLKSNYMEYFQATHTVKPSAHWKRQFACMYLWLKLKWTTINLKQTTRIT